MTALALIAHLAGRGLMLSIEGARLRAAPASLLTDEDRRLIRRFREELFALLSERARTRPSEPGPLSTEPPVVESVEAVEETGRTGASMVLHHRPDSLARWPIADRQRWGELANQLEAEGVSWQEAERRAYETVRGEREAAGRSGDFVFIEEHPTPEPFPEWNQLIDPRDYLPKPPPPRPLGSPTWGVTESIRVVELASWTPCRQAKDPVIKVTAEGWEQWSPVEPRDLPRMKEGIAAEASQNLFDWEAI